MATILLPSSKTKDATAKDPSLRAKIGPFISKLSTMTTSSGLHLEPIRGSRDRRVRTARVTDFYRAVLFELAADGEVVFVFDTKHAIGMKSADGTEYLLHIGVDTVALGGKGFEVFVEAGQQVKKGDRLMKFDIDYIRANATSDACLVIFTGLPEGTSVEMTATGEVKALDPVAKL